MGGKRSCICHPAQPSAADEDGQIDLTEFDEPCGQQAELDEKVRVLVFYAIRELLFNVVKHSGILAATVIFESYDDTLRVIVRDNGKGFPSQGYMSNRSLGHGLLSLRHRLDLLGCTMEVNSEIGSGTESSIEVPLEQPKEEL